MRNLLFSSLVVLTLAVAVVAQTSPMSQSTDNTTITAGNTVACVTTAAPQYHAVNSFIRAYTPSAEGINFPIDVTCIGFGLEYALAGAAANPVGTQPATINLYIDDPAAPVFPGALPGPPVATQAVVLNDTPATGGVLLTQGITTPVTITPNQILIVEFFLPDGIAPQNIAFVASNAAGETAPSYLMSAGCGTPTPTPYAAIGFPTVNLILDVHWNQTGLTPPPAVTFNLGTPNATTGETPFTVVNDQLTPGNEYFNFYSFSLCPGGPGTGPYLGMCYPNFNDLVTQFQTPLGIFPLHWIADNCRMESPEYSFPTGLAFEVICVDLTGGQLVGNSQVVFVQF